MGKKERETGKISDNKMQEFKDEMEKFKYLRQNRVSYWQSIAIVFGTSSIILLIDLITKDDNFTKLLFIIFLFLLANWAYRKAVIQTQKPIFVCDNAIGTIEKMGKVKGKNGEEYAIFKMSDFLHKGDKI